MLISPSELSQIAREVAPTFDEGRYGVWEDGGDSVPAGGGFRKSPGVLIGSYPGRIRYTGDMTPEQKARAGISLVEGDYILELAPGGWARPGHVIRQIPDQWKPGKFEVTGALRSAIVTGPAPATPNTYRAVVNGQSGFFEPTWPVMTGAYVVDGTLEWRCEGPTPSYSVMAEIGPSTYGDYLGRMYSLQVNQTQR